MEHLPVDDATELRTLEARDRDALFALVDANTEPEHTASFIEASADRIGYWLREDRQGQGLVTGSCRALIRHAFGPLGLNRVDILAAVENHGSRAIAERLGFRQYGVVPEAEWLYDHFVDHAQYALTLQAHRERGE